MQPEVGYVHLNPETLAARSYDPGSDGGDGVSDSDEPSVTRGGRLPERAVAAGDFVLYPTAEEHRRRELLQGPTPSPMHPTTTSLPPQPIELVWGRRRMGIFDFINR